MIWKRIKYFTDRKEALQFFFDLDSDDEGEEDNFQRGNTDENHTDDDPTFIPDEEDFEDLLHTSIKIVTTSAENLTFKKNSGTKRRTTSRHVRLLISVTEKCYHHFFFLTKILLFCSTKSKK